MNDPWIDLIIANWKFLGIKLNSGSTVSEIAKVEHQIGIHFPDDFKELYMQVDGFADWDWTPTMFSLWPLERIVTEYTDSANLKFVGFCDYLINSHSIGFIKGTIGVFKDYGNGKPELIAPSFSEAIHLININAAIIY